MITCQHGWKEVAKGLRKQSAQQKGKKVREWAAELAAQVAVELHGDGLIEHGECLPLLAV